MSALLTPKEYERLGFYNVWKVVGSKGSVNIGNQTHGYDAINYAQTYFDLGTVSHAEFIYGDVFGTVGQIVEEKRGAK